MSDKELLELAARAYWPNDDEVSFRFDASENAIVFLAAENQDHNGHDCERVWNPLTDDGDALRLAVKLHLHIHVDNGYGTAVRRPDAKWLACEAHKFGGMEAATRRAITMAAAEIGRATSPHAERV